MMTQTNSDQGLKEVLLENSKTITFYYRKDCEQCKQLLVDFDELEKNEVYENIAFVLINADESFLADRLATQIPFVSTYDDGLLVECKSVNDKTELMSMLTTLRADRFNN